MSDIPFTQFGEWAGGFRTGEKLDNSGIPDRMRFIMAHFLSYELSRAPLIGWVNGYGVSPIGIVEQRIGFGEKLFIIPHEGSFDWYVDLSTFTAKRKEESTAYLVGTDIHGVPEGADVYALGEVMPCDDGVAELEFDHPGTYRVEVRSPTQPTKIFEVVWP